MKVLKQDIKRTYDLVPGNRFIKCIQCARTPAVRAIIVFRFGHWIGHQHKVLKLLLFPIYFFLNWISTKNWGIVIPRTARIGPGLYIGHFGGVVISADAVIGRNATLSHQVTIGASGQGDKLGVPVIGDDVYIAPGAKLFGKIVIGNRVKIGANAVIHKDIPDMAVVVLDPGYKIISYKGNTPTT